MTILLDASILIALSHPAHEHHAYARAWFAQLDDSFATCPITQGSLLRHTLRQGFDTEAAIAGLTRITHLPGHIFWADSISYQEVRTDNVIGHRQVTDAYLAQLARAHGGSISTFDRGFATLHQDVAVHIPTST